MAFEEPGSVAYLYEGDKKIAQIKVDTTVVLKNLKTGKEYDSDAEGDPVIVTGKLSFYF